MAALVDDSATTSNENATPESYGPPLKLDALIVGAGFGGVYQLKKLRDRGYNVKLVEAGGARVDSTVPHYEYSDPELWKDWRWSQRFPGSAELREYFAFVAKKWDLRKDSIFDTFVNSAVWNNTTKSWTIGTTKGDVFEAQFFLPNTGFAAKRHLPNWPGMNTFKGIWIHPSYWPHEDRKIDVNKKRVAVIGTGSTGVQLCQEISQLASEFVLFQRTPNLALPMKQKDYKTKQDVLDVPRHMFTEFFAARNVNFGGFAWDFMSVATFDHTPEQRKATYEKLWNEGDFHFWLATYHDMLFSVDANKEAYNFWQVAFPP
ncbi:hypothetical protein LTR15_012959 [Elasticomyces elasticus]|nr:hypothetical protein LTR15_012959 [Elasticomyces elasticus]